MTEITRRTILAGAGAAAVAPLAGAPARAAAPLAGKQAPGFYRYKVGSHEITAVTDGIAVFPLADNFVANAKKDDVNAALQAGFYEKDKIANPFTPVVVNTGSKLVLIDTGYGQAAYEQSKGARGQLHTNLPAAGFDAKAIDVVIISHFHPDHYSGLVDTANTPLFPNAEVMVPAAEWAFWMDEGNMSRAPDVLKGYAATTRKILDAYGNKVSKFDAGKEVVPGITAMATPGHTPGHTSFVVASGPASVLVQVDIAFLPTLFLRNPDWHLLFDMDRAKTVETRRKVYDQAVADRMLVQGYHFPFPSVGHIEKDGNGYRWVPLPWNPVV